MTAARIDFKAIAARALEQAEQLVPAWLPGGKRSGHEWQAINPTREDRKAGSFSVNLRSGEWADFASDDKGGDLISLYAYLTQQSQADAARAVAETLGIEIPNETGTRKPGTSRPMAAPAGATGSAGAEIPAKKTKTAETIIPVPDDAPPAPVAHTFRGVPDSRWTYRDRDGKLLGYVCRFTTSDGGKEIIPLTYVRENGACAWRWKAFSEPRPLYGLERLAAQSSAPVLIVEGEKCADAAAAELPGYACITWPSGSKAVGKIDWTPLKGRRSILWPDCDAQMDKSGQILPADQQPGIKAMRMVAERLGAFGCEIAYVNIPAPGDKAPGWDIADAIAEGLTGPELNEWMTSRIQGFTRNLEPDAPPASLADAKEKDSWRHMLLYRRSECVSCLSNIHLILTHEDCWQGVIAYDEFSQRVMKRKAPPFVGGTSGEWEANDDACTAIWLTRLFSMTPSLSQVGQAVEVVARRNAFHPVREWLKSLHPHDGVPRLGDWLSDFVGVPKTEYTQLVGRYFLTGMVARVMDPGCKFDYCMVLEGAQGQGKSTLFSILAGEWFGDTDLDLYNKDSMSALRGKWLYEFAELDAIARAESSRHKSFLSRKIDEFRPAYASREVRFPRQTVFGGSVNQWEWNKDPTGGRRFWPIEVKQEIALEELSRAREKLFAEALAEYTAGARYWPTRWHQMEYFDPEQLKIERSESLVDALHDWVFTQYQEFSLADAVIHGLDLDASKLTRDMETRVGNALRKLGCERVEKRNGMTRFWYKPPQKSATTSASSEDANAAF